MRPELSAGRSLSHRHGNLPHAVRSNAGPGSPALAAACNLSLMRHACATDAEHAVQHLPPEHEVTILPDVLQDLSCSDYAALVASYYGSAAAGADCSGNLKRLAVAQQHYDVPFAPASLVMNDPAFVGAPSQHWNWTGPMTSTHAPAFVVSCTPWGGDARA